MVEYFGERLAGFSFTKNGWVQSYGSRCVKPPVIYGDVAFINGMTIKETVYAQSLTGESCKRNVNRTCYNFKLVLRSK